MRNLMIYAALAAFGAVGAASAATVYSEDFEGNLLATNSTPEGWTLDSGSVDTIGTGFFEWYGEGTYIDMNGSTSTAGSISTSVTGLTVGDSYTLTFDVGYNNNSGNAEQLSFAIGDLAGSYGSPILSGSSTFLTLSYTFTATAETETLMFADTGNSDGDDGGPILDNINVSSISPAPVPLPAAGLMLLAGLGGLAAVRRRKSAK